MSTLRAGYTWGAIEVPTAAAFHQMVEDAEVVDLLPTELISGVDYVHTTTAAVPVLGDNYMTLAGQLAFHDGTSYALQDTLHPFIMTLQSAYTPGNKVIERGMCVFLKDTASTPQILAKNPSDPSLTIGIALEQIQPQAIGQVLVRGAMLDCLVNSRPDDRAVGAFLYGSGDYPHIEEDPVNVLSGGFKKVDNFFGMTLEVCTGNTASTLVSVSVYIWR